MSDAPAERRPGRKRRILESLPDPSDVREEVLRTSRRMKLLVDLLGLCEKAEGDRPRSRSKSAKA